jgi:protein SCO1/2
MSRLRLLLLLVLLMPLAAWAQEKPVLDGAAALRASQAAIGRTIGEHVLLDREGHPVRLSEYRGEPLLVSFIYTGCFQVCPANTRALDEAVGRLQQRFGSDSFRVASIGFNQPADTPQAMKAFATQQRITRPHWEFLSPAAAAVPALARDFGFQYAATPAGFDHVLQVTVLDGHGRIVRQLYGERPPAEELAEALTLLLAGQALPPPTMLEQLADRIRILCTVYDPETGTVRVSYALAWEIAGGLSFILFIALYMLNEWRARRRERRHGPLAHRA